MPTGLLPEPLLVVANNLFGRQCSAMSPTSTARTRNASRLTSSPLGRTVGSDKRRCLKAFVIAEPCIGTKDTACVDACPVDRIHPKKNTTYDDAHPGFDEVPQLYIDPIECIDCGACVPVCPVSAIFALHHLPEKWKRYMEINASYVQGGKFTPEEYAKHKAAK